MRLSAFVILASFSLCLAASGQEIPKGVRYHRASDAANAAAAKRVSLLFANQYSADQLVGMSERFLIVGPGLWGAVKKNSLLDLNTGIPVTFYVPTKKHGVQELIARGMKTPAQQRAFWKMFLDNFSEIHPTVRKANAADLDYYWSIISYDIQEPLYIAQFRHLDFLFDSGSAGSTKFFFVDIVLPMEKD